MILKKEGNQIQIQYETDMAIICMIDISDQLHTSLNHRYYTWKIEYTQDPSWVPTKNVKQFLSTPPLKSNVYPMYKFYKCMSLQVIKQYCLKYVAH